MSFLFPLLPYFWLALLLGAILAVIIAAVVLPMTPAERFTTIGIKAPMGVLLYGLPVPALAKMLINVLATTALCLASYHLCVRFTAVSQWLNGRRHTRKSFGDSVHAT